MLQTTIEQKQRLRRLQKNRYNQSDKGKARTKAWAKKIREDVFNHYGSECVCCGERTPEFLCIDHANNGRGNPADRHGTSGGPMFYAWIKRNNYPDDLQVLCHNCNMAKALYGICPHQTSLEYTAKLIKEHHARNKAY
jgi:hypothetical protein